MNTKPATHGGARPVLSMAYNLAGIAILALLVAVGAAYLIDGAERARKEPVPTIADQAQATVTISGQELTIPASWFRDPGEIQQGFSNQIDLRLEFAPPGGGAAMPIDVSLVPRSRVRPSSVLLDGVYLHQFDDASVTGVVGLVGKPLKSTSGFTGETVWYDALSPNPFVAKCLAPIEPKRAGRCLRTVYLETGIAAIYSFDADALVGWQSFDEQMRKWLGQIGAV